MPEVRSRRRLIAVVVSLIIALLLCPWLWLQAVTASKWSAMEKRVALLLEEQAKRAPSRPVLRGEALTGNAWEDYGLAIARIENLPSAPLYDFVQRQKGADPEAIGQIVTKHQESIRLLQKGVRRSTAQNPKYRRTLASLAADGVHMLDADAQDKDWVPAGNLSMLAICQSRLRQESDPKTAVELLLDDLQFVRDFAHNGSTVNQALGFGFEKWALLEMHDLMTARVLPPDLMSEIARELGILDENFPRRDFALLNDVAMTGTSFLRGNIGATGFVGKNPERLERVWQYGFSLRLRVADGFSRIDRWHQWFIEANSGSWSGEIAVRDQLVRTASDSPTWDLEREAVGPLSSGRTWRMMRAQLRLLRIAAHFIATGDVLTLDDPFGDRLRHSLKDGSLKVWSLGITGNDHSGQGDFRGEKQGKVSGEPGPIPLNIVIEVRR